MATTPDTHPQINQEAFVKAGIEVSSDATQFVKDPQIFVTGIRGDGVTIRLNVNDFGGPAAAKTTLRTNFGIRTENILDRTVTSDQLIKSGRKG